MAKHSHKFHLEHTLNVNTPKYKVFTQYYVFTLWKKQHMFVLVLITGDCIPLLNFQIVNNDVLTLNFGWDPRPWTLLDITNTSGLDGFCTEHSECFRLKKEMKIHLWKRRTMWKQFFLWIDLYLKQCREQNKCRFKLNKTCLMNYPNTNIPTALALTSMIILPILRNKD